MTIPEQVSYLFSDKDPHAPDGDPQDIRKHHCSDCLIEALERVQKEEREACAQVVEKELAFVAWNWKHLAGMVQAAVDAIRNRGKQ